jgi:hypothetical protein
MQLTHSLKAPGSKVISYQVISWFQSLPFKCNLHRYNAGDAITVGRWQKLTEGEVVSAVGLYKLSSVDP